MDRALILSLIVFTVLTTINVVLNTARVIITVKGGVFLSSIISALAFGFYTIMTVVIVSSPLDNWAKGLITAIVNFVGTYFVKYIELKFRKDRLWMVDVVIYEKNLGFVREYLGKRGLEYSDMPMSNSGSHVFHIYANTRDESRAIRKLLSKMGAKYVVVESKSL